MTIYLLVARCQEGTFTNEYVFFCLFPIIVTMARWDRESVTNEQLE